jgi:carboxylesterase
VHSENKALAALPVLRFLRPSIGGIGSDIKKPGITELAYDRTPLKALHSLSELWRVVRADLGAVTQPVLLFRSPEDHVVEPSNSVYITSHVGSPDVEERLLPNSYHVATLDHDAEAIFAGSLEFVRRLAPAATGG